MTEKKDMKIEFAPGCFDNFEGTQEELDEMIADIKNMFAGKTPEELEAMSKPLSEEDFLELPEDVQVKLMSFDPDSLDQPKRNLQ